MISTNVFLEHLQNGLHWHNRKTSEVFEWLAVRINSADKRWRRHVPPPSFSICTIRHHYIGKQDPTLKKQINKGIDFIVSSIASLVTKVVSSGAIYNATVFVSQEIGEFFNDGSIPKIMRNKYDELVRRLATALERKRNIEDLCSKLLGEVRTTCK